jgi:hypothetical protein
MKDIMRNGELGTIQKIEVWFHVPGNILLKDNDIRFKYALIRSPPPPSCSLIFPRYGLAGGSMMDLGCYVVNFIR